MKVKLEKVRAAFLDAFEPDTKFNRYGGVFIIEPGSANAKSMKQAVEAVAKDKWGAKAEAILAKLTKDGNVCYAEGPKLDSNGEPYSGFENMHHVGTGNKARPLVIDRDKTPLTAADGRPYSGCYVNAMLDVWAQDNEYGKRINATLTGLQFNRDGDAFTGGAPASQDDFDDLGDTGDADDDMA